MVAAKPITNSPDEDLQLCQAFAACKSANILVTESSACCRLCSNEIMWRVELCPACGGTFTGFTFYHMQAAYKAIHSGKLNLFFNCFTEEATDEELTELGHRIVASIRGAGMSVKWNGSPDETIVIKDLTSSERDYIRRKLGPDNYNWAKAALKMADKMGPISGGEIFHDCDCMEFSCFCGKVKHLGDPDDSVSEGVGQEAGSDSDWTTCSEDEFEELQKESCPYNEQLGDCCSPTCQVDPASQKLSAMCL